MHEFLKFMLVWAECGMNNKNPNESGAFGHKHYESITSEWSFWLTVLSKRARAKGAKRNRKMFFCTPCLSLSLAKFHRHQHHNPIQWQSGAISTRSFNLLRTTWNHFTVNTLGAGCRFEICFVDVYTILNEINHKVLINSWHILSLEIIW